MASGGTANPSSWNRYAYVEGDPVNRYDPLGLFYAAPGQAPPPVTGPAAEPVSCTINGMPISDPLVCMARGEPIGGPVQAGLRDSRSGLTYTDPSRDGAHQEAIQSAFSSLRTGLSTAAGEKCNSWLSKGNTLKMWGMDLGSALDGLSYIVGHAEIRSANGRNDTTIAVTTTFVEGYSILFNRTSSFFTNGGVGPGDRYRAFIDPIAGNSATGREFIWLHELGHWLSLPGFVSDFGDDPQQTKHRANNDAVWENCGALLMRRR